jgi:lysine 2,3-aminomutase
MDDLQAPPSEPPGSPSEPTSTPLSSNLIELTNARPSSWRQAEGLLSRPFEPRQRGERFPHAPDSRAFRREWNDWRWQLRNRIRSLEQLERIFQLSPDEHAAVARHKGSLPVGITPYYASLMGRDDPLEPLRRTHIPVGQEYLRARARPTTRWARTTTPSRPGWCTATPTGCCSWPPASARPTAAIARARAWSARPGGEYQFSTRQWEQALTYIEAHPEIRDVLLSGGDPLTMPTRSSTTCSAACAAIKHVEFIRIGTKVPVVLPMRITRSLTRMLRKHHPLWMSIHVTHPERADPRGHRGLRPAGRRRHSARQPDGAAEGHQRRRSTP